MIDQKRIGEWEAMLRHPMDAVTLNGVPCGVSVNYLARAALPILLAEREEMLFLLREAADTDDCSWCHHGWGKHSPGCCLAVFLGTKP